VLLQVLRAAQGRKKGAHLPVCPLECPGSHERNSKETTFLRRAHVPIAAGCQWLALLGQLRKVHGLACTKLIPTI
jgi:hypothetical protein